MLLLFWLVSYFIKNIKITTVWCSWVSSAELLTIEKTSYCLALFLGLKKTASTFFFIDEGADTGDIISQEFIKIENDNASL